MGESERRDELAERCRAWFLCPQPMPSSFSLEEFVRSELARAESRARDEALYAPPAPAPAALSDAEKLDAAAEILDRTDNIVAHTLRAEAAKLRAQAEPVDVFEAYSQDVSGCKDLWHSEKVRSWFGPALDALREIAAGTPTYDWAGRAAREALAALDQRAREASRG